MSSDLIRALHDDAEKRLDTLAHQIAASATPDNFAGFQGRYRQLKEELNRFASMLRRSQHADVPELPEATEIDEFLEPSVKRKPVPKGPRPRPWGGGR